MSPRLRRTSGQGSSRCLEINPVDDGRGLAAVDLRQQPLIARDVDHAGVEPVHPRPHPGDRVGFPLALPCLVSSMPSTRIGALR